MSKENVSYDPEIIQQFASSLYDQARSILVKYAVLGGVLGLVAGGAVAYSTDPGIGASIGLVLGAVIGYARAKEKAFELKLKAQTALCQRQIELNTKNAG